VQARLFEPYVTSKQGGTGLGLPIAHRIVTDHGGSIEVTTGAGGTVFDVALPVAGPPEVEATAEG
jgi:two-component system nitrogen regulation sensor histidine kinase GlnL